MTKNIENFARLMHAISAMKKPIEFSWHHCYAGMAWNLEGKPTLFPSMFDLSRWLGISEQQAEQLEYLEGLKSTDGNIEYFNRQPLAEQKRILIYGLQTLLDTDAVIWPPLWAA